MIIAQAIPKPFNVDASKLTTGNLDVDRMPLSGDWTLTGDLNIGDAGKADILHIDTDNDRVGIGTEAPSKRLHIVSTNVANFQAAMVVENTGGGNTPTATGILFSGRGGGLNKGGIAFEDVSEIGRGRGNLYFLNDGADDDNEATLDDIRMTIASVGNVGFNTTEPVISDGAGVHIAGKIIRLATSKTPASAGDTGNEGEICWDADYLYICVSANTWQRIAHDTWV